MQGNKISVKTFFELLDSCGVNEKDSQSSFLEKIFALKMILINELACSESNEREIGIDKRFAFCVNNAIREYKKNNFAKIIKEIKDAFDNYKENDILTINELSILILLFDNIFK